MNLSRRTSQIIAIVTLLIFASAGAYILAGRKNSSQLTENSEHESAVESSTKLESPETPEQHSLFSLQEFHRVQTKDGKVLWEVWAKDGKYYPQSNSAEVSEATLSLFRKEGGGVVKISAPSATLKLDGTELKAATARGGVVVTLDDKLVLKTEEAALDRTSNIVTAPGFVEIKGDLIYITGRKLRADLNSQEVELQQDVETTLKSKGQEQ